MEEKSFESAFEVLSSEEIKRKYDVEKHNDRDLYIQIKKSLSKEPRTKILIGLRGIGKTTMLLHLTSNTKNNMFFSMDHPIFEKINLFEFIKYLSKVKGITTFFIDEVQYYLSWPKEIKALYDWNKDLEFIISGSSALGLYNLDRRARIYHLTPLSFREFLRYSNVKLGQTVDWKNHQSSKEFIIKYGLEKYFNDYLSGGGFLNYFNMSKEDFIKTTHAGIKKSIRQDAVLYSKMSKEKVYDLEKIITFLALSQPGELSYTSLSSTLGIGKGTILELLDILQKMELIRILIPYPSSSASVRQQPKMLFSHPNIRYITSKSINIPINIGAIREEFALFHLSNSGYKAYTIKGEKKSPDYIIEKGKEKYIIEIGGRSKKRKQLPEGGIIVKEHNLMALGLI